MFKRVTGKVAGISLMAALACSVALASSDSPTAATKAKKITLNKTKIVMRVGEQETIKVKKVTPKKAGKAVLFKSSRKAVAKVTKKGRVTAVSEGTAKITVTSKSNKKVSKVVKVTVKPKEAQGGAPAGSLTPQGTGGSNVPAGDNGTGNGDGANNEPAKTDAPNVTTAPAKTDAPNVTTAPAPGNGEMEEPTALPTTEPGQNAGTYESDVAALEKIIKEQRAGGATVSEDINDSEQYWWENGRLTHIFWFPRDKNGSQIDGKGLGLNGDLNLSAFTALERADVVGDYTEDGKGLTSLDVTNCPKLQWLDCSGNQLTELDVRDIGVDQEYGCRLDCSDNQLTELDVTNCPGLGGLDCSDNQLTELDVTNCPGLGGLYCSGNQLTELDVTNCPGLWTLLCSGNQLTELDVTNCAGLSRLDCSGNQLTELDVTNCAELYQLDCSGNQLITLDLSNCPKFTEEYMENYADTIVITDPWVDVTYP